MSSPQVLSVGKTRNSTFEVLRLQSRRTIFLGTKNHRHLGSQDMKGEPKSILFRYVEIDKFGDTKPQRNNVIGSNIGSYLSVEHIILYFKFHLIFSVLFCVLNFQNPIFL